MDIDTTKPYSIMNKLSTLLAGAALLLASTALNAQDATIRIHDGGTGEPIPAEIYAQFS